MMCEEYHPLSDFILYRCTNANRPTCWSELEIEENEQTEFDKVMDMYQAGGSTSKYIYEKFRQAKHKDSIEAIVIM